MEKIVQKLLAVEAELKRRKAGDRLAQYNTGKKKHRKQIAFHRSKKRNRWVFGGNRSGKTECGAAECVYMARGIHPYRRNKKDVSGWVVSLSQQVQRDVAQKKILYYLRPDWIEEIVMLSGRRDFPESGVIDLIRVKNVFGGVSTIGFKSCDQGREKFQGSSLDFVWFDEEPPKDVYEECRMRVMDKKGDIFGTMTPLKGITFLYDEIYMNKRGNPEVWYEFMEWKDNPYLSKEEIRLLENSMDEETLQARKYGRFSAGEGLVYPEFDENVHVVEPQEIPPEWQDTISIDPGLHNPLAALWFAVDPDDNVYVLAEYYQAEKDIDYHADRIKEICRRLGWKEDGRGRVRAIIDSAANQRTLASPRSVTELFYERGILADPDVNKDLFAGIGRVKSYLKRGNGQPDLYIFRGCVHLIRELKGYFWGEGDVPKKRDDHALDALRYYLMTRPKGRAAAEEKTEIQKDKERRLRNLIRRRRGGM